MQALTGVEIVEAVGMGRRPDGRRSWRVQGVSTDSRTVGEADLFVALPGDRFDGHDYVETAFARGAAAALVSRPVNVSASFQDRPTVLVDDTVAALGRLARYYRKRWGRRVIAITGSNGKTTTREILWRLLSARFSAVRSPKSFNNAIGVPLTIFQIHDHDMAVIEMGTNAPGEIASLAAIALPDYGIVTNVGETHLEGLGSVEGVARAKGELVETLGDNGVAFLNADDPWSDALARRHRGPNVFFGRSARADVRCVEARRTETGHCFRLADGHEFELNVPGLHNVHNALAALAVCRELGILDDVCDALASFRLPDLRYQAQQFGQVSVIADCYNANLGSMTAALDEFDAMAAPGRRVMVCGDMLEMGPHAERVHRQLGRRVGRSRVDRLWAIGPAGTWVVEAARGERPLAAEHRPDADEAIAEVVASVEPLDTVLVKGSRGMKMERVVEAIRLRYAETAGTAEGPLRRD